MIRIFEDNLNSEVIIIYIHFYYMYKYQNFWKTILHFREKYRTHIIGGEGRAILK